MQFNEFLKNNFPTSELANKYLLFLLNLYSEDVEKKFNINVQKNILDTFNNFPQYIKEDHKAFHFFYVKFFEKFEITKNNKHLLDNIESKVAKEKIKLANTQKLYLFYDKLPETIYQNSKIFIQTFTTLVRNTESLAHIIDNNYLEINQYINNALIYKKNDYYLFLKHIFTISIKENYQIFLETAKKLNIAHLTILDIILNTVHEKTTLISTSTLLHNIIKHKNSFYNNELLDILNDFKLSSTTNKIQNHQFGKINEDLFNIYSNNNTESTDIFIRLLLKESYSNAQTVMNIFNNQITNHLTKKTILLNNLTALDWEDINNNIKKHKYANNSDLNNLFFQAAQQDLFLKFGKFLEANQLNEHMNISLHNNKNKLKI